MSPVLSLILRACLIPVLVMVGVSGLRAEEAVGSGEDPLLQAESELLAGIQWAICYSGFRDGQHPDRGNGAKNPSEEEILEDLQIMKKAGFRMIRLYDAKENAEVTLRLIREHDLGIRVLLGAWLDGEVNNPDCPWKPEPFTAEELEANRKSNAKEVEAAIKLANEYPKIVASVAVGNEALVIWNDHMVPVDDVIDYVKKTKAEIEQPVTVADNYDWWIKDGAKLAEEVDYLSVHIYPVWEGKGIDEGLSYSIANLEGLRRAHPDKTIVITEAGWATTASEFGERAGEDQQQRYYQELKAWTRERNITTFFFEAFDESWKGDPGNPLGAEKHWGIFKIDRTPKKVMR